jgi:hypothetical protein
MLDRTCAGFTPVAYVGFTTIPQARPRSEQPILPHIIVEARALARVPSKEKVDKIARTHLGATTTTCTTITATITIAVVHLLTIYVPYSCWRGDVQWHAVVW